MSLVLQHSLRSRIRNLVIEARDRKFITLTWVAVTITVTAWACILMAISVGTVL